MGQLTFQSLCKRLENKHDFGSHVENLNTLIGAVACLTGQPAAGGIIAFIKALAEKEKLIDLGKKAVSAILDQKPRGYSRRIEQMEEAYGIIYFTAFFDELDQRLPDNIRKSIELSQREKQNLFEHSVRLENSEALDKREILFPDIVSGYTMVDKDLRALYRTMAIRLQNFVKNLSFQDTACEKDVRSFEKIIEDLPSAAVERFHDQYRTLCISFNEFYIFTQMEHWKEEAPKWEARYQEILSAAMCVQNSAEAGLAGLKKIIEDMPVQIKKEKVQEIVNGLVRTYQKGIDQPLIDTKSDEEKLTYPLISKAFIPQSYKLLRYSGKEHLEQKETWEAIKPEENMESFWAKYCLDLGSVDNLLLILGEPGGGKSLLTKILCARMIAPNSICIRIPLREQNVEDEIETIVCRQIAKDGDASEPISTFKWFAEEFQNNPVTLLFDGYDEVMQATGGIYRSLLKRIQRFQDVCRNQHRPVRIVVTSRETLIDKADIPKKTMVMKLLEFDKTRKDQWINIWNAHNHRALTEAGIRDFSLPEGNKDIEALSGQPLLLLMLAIYDANFETGTNALKGGQAESLDRTKLYDELLRRFVRRELQKGPRGQSCAYEEVNADKRNAMVDEEMKKLGIAALGMFVREKLSLKVEELENDLAYMKAETFNYGSRNTTMLKNAEAVFGSFFFIHDSRRKNEGKSETNQKDEDEKEAAFEFLHKTFYEFLVADLILQYLIDAVDDLSERKSSSRRGEAYYWEALEKPDSLDHAYYATLNSACLCTEPEIIRMIAEWKDGKLRQYFQKDQKENSNFSSEMAQVLSELFAKHVEIIRTGVFTPFVEKRGGLAGGKAYPQACAVYLMNLTIMQILTGGECRIKSGEWDYISQFLKLNIPLPSQKPAEELEERDPRQTPGISLFEEVFLKSAEKPEGRKPRRKLKINPYEEMLLKFMALFQILRKGEDIVLIKRTQSGKFERETLQEARKDVFDFMQDDVNWKVYRLHDADSSLEQRQQYRHDLSEQGFNFGFELALAQLHESLNNLNGYKLEELILFGVKCLDQGYADKSLVLDWLLCVHMLASQKKEWHIFSYISNSLWGNMGNTIFWHYRDEREIVLAFLEIVKELNCVEILLETRWIPKMLDYWSHGAPDLAMALVETILCSKDIHRNAFLSQTARYDGELKRIYVRSMTSPGIAAAILKILCATDMISPSDSFLWDTKDSWDEWLWNQPEELPALLRVYLQMGKIEEVKEFIQYALREDEHWVHNLLKKSPKSLNDFLSIAQIVGEKRSLIKCIVHYVRNYIADIRELQTQEPQWCALTMGVIHYGIGDNYLRTDINFLVYRFFEDYDKMFHCNPEKAVSLLLRIVSKRGGSDYSKRIPDACMYSFRYYSFLLGTSVMAAARLLTVNEKLKKSNSPEYEFLMERDRDGNKPLAFYAELCFNKAVADRNRAGEGALVEFLENMCPDTKVAMEKYFKKRFLYLRAYSIKLAEKVKKIYSLS